jgi:sugar lactone lactonase YvrE
VTVPRTLLTGIILGESPRWHDGRLWFCDWGAHEISAVGLAGLQAGDRDTGSEVMARVAAFPFCIDWGRTGGCSSSRAATARCCAPKLTGRCGRT